MGGFGLGSVVEQLADLKLGGLISLLRAVGWARAALCLRHGCWPKRSSWHSCANWLGTMA